MKRLRRSQLSGPGISRRRSGRGFTYRGPDGRPIDDPETLERIRLLAIPPAWADVWICPWPNGHIQAVGTDAAGRRQYRYHDQWRQRRDEEKFCRMLEFARQLPDLRRAVERDLSLPELEKAKVLALGVRLLEVGMFRIGGEEYAEEHETYGLATLEKRHASIRAGKAQFCYRAKSGKERSLVIADPVVVEVLRQLKRRRSGGEALLAWRERGRWYDVRSEDLNAYLKEQTGGPFTAKDFRTWDATLLAALRLAACEVSDSPSARQRTVAAVVREVAETLGNTATVCRKSYIDPKVIDHFERGETIAAQLEAPAGGLDPEVLAAIEASVVELLEQDRANSR